MSREILARIAREAGVPDLVEVLERLPGADLTSLLLEVMRRRSARLTAADLRREQAASAPSDIDARRYAAFIDAAFAAAAGFDAVELSPLCPVGTNTVLGRIDQNNVLATIRGSEVLADPTTALALHAARLPRPARLCATARLVRMQPLTHPAFRRHFRQFALVTAGRVEPLAALREHIEVHLRLLRGLAGYRWPGLEVAVGDFSGRHNDLERKLLAPLASAFPEASFRLDREREQGRGYYTGPYLTLSAVADGERIPVGDGGFSDWMARLTSDRKERFLGTGLGVEMMMGRFGPP